MHGACTEEALALLFSSCLAPNLKTYQAIKSTQLLGRVGCLARSSWQA